MTDEECLELVKNAPWKFEKMSNKTYKYLSKNYCNN